MTIIFRDEFGYLTIRVNDDGISFCDGYAYFTGTDCQDYQVPVQHLVNIANDTY